MDSYTTEFGTIWHRIYTTWTLVLHYTWAVTQHGRLHYMDDYTKRTVILHTRQLHYITSTCCLMAFCSSLNLLSSLYNTWKLLPASSWDLAIRSVCIFNSLSALPRSLKNKCEVKHNYRIKCFIYPWIFILFIKYNYKQPCKFYKSCIHLFHFEF